MKKIKLTQGKYALVDNDDYEWLNQWKWCARKGGNTFYAHRDEKGTTLSMHRVLLQTPKGMHSDHINGNGLDNRRKNLRICTPAQNQMNRKRQANSTGFRGVFKARTQGRYSARIIVRGQPIYLGTFKTAKEASKAYNEAARKYYGEYAYQNRV